MPGPVVRPMLAGLELPAPNRAPRTREHVETVTTLASGREVASVRGFRYVYALEWRNLTGTEVDLVATAAASMGTVDYRTVFGELVRVRVVGPPELDPVPGSPDRFSCSITLREPGIRSAFTATAS